MKEILFKAKTCNGEWVQGLLANKDNKWYISNKAGQSFAYEVRPETICQYTGLTDKNGNKIWEHDIVSGNFGWHKGIYAIKWLDNEAKFSFPTISTIKENEYEVIGNIFDNPQLLEG